MTPLPDLLPALTLAALVSDAWRIVARRIWPEWDVLTAPDWVWELPGAEIATLRRMREVGAVITAQRRMSDAETLLLARVVRGKAVAARPALPRRRVWKGGVG